MDMGYELHSPAALNRAGTEHRLDGHVVVGRGGKEKRSCSRYEPYPSVRRTRMRELHQKNMGQWIHVMQ
jgi:hypothetical protein